MGTRIASTAELPGMLAALCSYEERFGARSVHTLRLAIVIADEFRRLGELARSQRILQAVVSESAAAFGPDHDLRVEALSRLRELLLGNGDAAQAIAVQRELINCRPEMVAERTRFAGMVFAAPPECPKSVPGKLGTQ